MAETRIIVIDDDPTGSQTVHGCLLLTRFDPATLKLGLGDDSPLMFILSNTRGMSAAAAADLTREICVNLRQALSELANEGRDINPVLVSRSDSTLRGHYPVETDVMAEELGPFDAHFLVPAFFEGGRVTLDSQHYLQIDDNKVPVHETEFARDSVFGFSHSYLPDYVEEKTGGRIRAGEVERFTARDPQAEILPRLLALEHNTCCVVDGVDQAQLNAFCEELMAAAGQGKRFLFRSAASLLTALAQLPPQPVAAEAMHDYVRGELPGVVLVGSHVAKTTAQLQALLAADGTGGIEVDVSRINPVGEADDSLLAEVLAQVQQLQGEGRSPVIYTSRQERQFDDSAQRLTFGEQVSALLMDIVRRLPAATGFLISKGGITSNDVLSQGLALRASRVLGQVHAGCSVVRCPADHPRFADMPVVIFPGNVGDDQALAAVYRIMAGHKP